MAAGEGRAKEGEGEEEKEKKKKRQAPPLRIDPPHLRHI